MPSPGLKFRNRDQKHPPNPHNDPGLRLWVKKMKSAESIVRGMGYYCIFHPLLLVIDTLTEKWPEGKCHDACTLQVNGACTPRLVAGQAAGRTRLKHSPTKNPEHCFASC